MTKDYFKRLNARDMTAWDLNCRYIISHNKVHNKLEKIFRRKARRIAKQLLKKESEVYND